MKKAEVKYLKFNPNAGKEVKRRTYIRVEGLVSDNFGIVKRGKEYIIIHLASTHSFRVLQQDKASTAKKYVDYLEKTGINWDATTLDALAEKNNKTPEEIFEVVKGALNG